MKLRSITWIAFSAALLSLRCLAQGTLTITFDGPPTTAPPGGSTPITQYTESGMSFTPIPPSTSFNRQWPDPALPGPYDGTIILWTGRSTESLMFSFTNGTRFQMVSVDLAEFLGASSVPFVGHRHDGTTVSTNFVTDGIWDGSGPLPDFQTFHFGPQFSDLDRVEIPGYSWSLDNVVVSIPEPSALGLLALGGLGMSWLGRGRRRR